MWVNPRACPRFEVNEWNEIESTRLSIMNGVHRLSAWSLSHTFGDPFITLLGLVQKPSLVKPLPKATISVEKTQFYSNQSIEDVLAGLLAGRSASFVVEYIGPASVLELGIQQLLSLFRQSSQFRGAPPPIPPYLSKTNTTTPLRFPTNICPPPTPHRIIPAPPSSLLMLRPPWPPTVNNANDSKPEKYENSGDKDNCPKDWIMVHR